MPELTGALPEVALELEVVVVLGAVDLPCVGAECPCEVVDLPWDVAALPSALLDTLVTFPLLAFEVCDFFDFPFEVDRLFALSAAVVGHGPSVSPCARCAGTAGAPTVIVTNGFVAECVW